MMDLNLPILHQLINCKNVLIAGMGGGFDIFCGLPIYFELRKHGKNVHLASLTSSSLKRLKGTLRLTPTLFGVTAVSESYTPYFPELHLSRWFKTEQHEAITIWCFEKTGVNTLLSSYQRLVTDLSIDAILLIDGGVDSLIRGDEAEAGSPVEDAVSLAVVNELQSVPVRLTCCLGFGAELEISYAHIFENMAALTSMDGFLGSCSLLKQMPCYQLYESALLYVQAQPRQDASVINSSVISAVRGHYSDYHLTTKTEGHELWISPLMSIYWFFDLKAVVDSSLFIPQLRETNTFEEAYLVVLKTREQLQKRSSSAIPLT